MSTSVALIFNMVMLLIVSYSFVSMKQEPTHKAVIILQEQCTEREGVVTVIEVNNGLVLDCVPKKQQ